MMNWLPSAVQNYTFFPRIDKCTFFLPHMLIPHQIVPLSLPSFAWWMRLSKLQGIGFCDSCLEFIYLFPVNFSCETCLFCYCCVLNVGNLCTFFIRSLRRIEFLLVSVFSFIIMSIDLHGPLHHFCSSITYNFHLF